MEEQNNLELETSIENEEIENKYVFVNTESDNSNVGKMVEKLNLNSNDVVIIMQSKNSKRISIESMKKLLYCGATIKFETVEIDINNSMDIQIAIDSAKIAVEQKSKTEGQKYENYVHGQKIEIESLFRYIANKFI